MTVKFTPGPWKWWTSNSWRRLTAHDVAGRYERDGNVLCPIKCRDGHPDVIISEADMALIAAAPDLYHALEEALHLMDISLRVEPDSTSKKLQAMERWRAAIAKARGDKP
jgi:hypothetical protein